MALMVQCPKCGKAVFQADVQIGPDHIDLCRGPAVSERNPDSAATRWGSTMTRMVSAMGPALDALHAEQARTPWLVKRLMPKRAKRRATAAYMRALAAQRELIEAPRRARG